MLGETENVADVPLVTWHGRLSVHLISVRGLIRTVATPSKIVPRPFAAAFEETSASAPSISSAMEFDPWAKAGLGLLRRLASLRQPAEGRNTRCGLNRWRQLTMWLPAPVLQLEAK